MDTLLTRLIFALAMLVLGVLAYQAYRQMVLRQVQLKTAGLEKARRGVPTILYFTTPSCAPCQTLQSPAIDRLTQAHGSALQVIKIDAQARPEIADHWGVLSVPTTFILDRGGKARFFNPGLARSEKLEQQLVQAGLTTADH